MRSPWARGAAAHVNYRSVSAQRRAGGSSGRRSARSRRNPSAVPRELCGSGGWIPAV